MKARIKGSNDEFKEVISLKRNLVELSDGHVYHIYHIYRLEFEQDRWQEPCKLNPEKDLSNPIDHWQDLRERAAIAIAPQCLKIVQDVLFRGGAINEETVAKQVAVNAVEYADALVEKLKGE